MKKLQDVDGDQICETIAFTKVMPDTPQADSAAENHQDLLLRSLEAPLPKPLFTSGALRGLSKLAKRALMERVQTRWFLPGERLLQQDQLGDGMYVLLEGSVRIEIERDGLSESIDVSGAGEILGEISLLASVPCTANVTAETPTRALLLERDDFQTLKQKFPELEIALSELISERLGSRETDVLSGKRIGDYKLRRCINRGGMGVVYEASDLSGKTVALKMLRHRYVHEKAAIDRFIREGNLLSELAHPNIVTVSNCFVAFNTRFIVMDYWDGQDLSGIVRKTGPVSEEVCRGILGQLACGLLYAHRQGIMHLDIKPANILVTRNGRVALTDFGLCKLIGDSDDANTVVGTLPYMPPEQLLACGVGEPSDWYALACTAVELLTRRRLFKGGSYEDVLHTKLTWHPLRNMPKLPVSQELARVIQDALHPDVDFRRLDLEMVSTWSRGLSELS